MALTVVSRYHSGAIKRRERPTLESAHQLAAWEVDAEGAHSATVIDGNTVIGDYEWRGGLTYRPATEA